LLGPHTFPAGTVEEDSGAVRRAGQLASASGFRGAVSAPARPARQSLSRVVGGGDELPFGLAGGEATAEEAVAAPDVSLAERLSTNRGALYKTLHDARRELRKHLKEQGLSVDALLGEET
jgi:hypothetical protein